MSIGELGSPAGNGKGEGTIAWLPCYRVIVIVSFGNKGTEDIFNGRGTGAARRTCPRPLWKVAARKLDIIDSAADPDDLRAPPGNRLETLFGDRKGQQSIRINEQYRICFVWTGLGAEQVEIVDYH